jgi:xylulokinase
MKAHLIGIDVGTGSTKTVLVDETGSVVATAVSQEYPLVSSRPGWAEQDPEHWWQAAIAGVRQVIGSSGVSPSSIRAVGLSGQMHGSVFLDRDNRVVRPAILWCDQRTADACAWITRTVGKKRLIELVSNPALTGFTAPKIIWVRTHEPRTYERISKVLLPKDYVRFRLTGEFATDVSDASGTLLLDVRRRRWSTDMLRLLAIPREWMPSCHESTAVTGAVTKIAAEVTGIPEGTPVVGGGGDQAAQAVGSGIVRRGLVSVTIGTSGVVFAHSDRPRTDPLGRLHTFCHAVPGKWHLMGVMLSAGGALRWLRDLCCDEEKRQAQQASVDPYELMTARASEIPAGAEGVSFLPYLSGERTPHADPHARGAFIGLSLRHTRAHLIRAVMEGVGFGLRDSLEIMRDLGIPMESIRLSGGGARSAVWRRMLCDMFNAPVCAMTVAEGASHGAALLAGVGAGVFPDVPAACDTLATSDRMDPVPDTARRFERLYRYWGGLYPKLKTSFRAAARLS